MACGGESDAPGSPHVAGASGASGTKGAGAGGQGAAGAGAGGQGAAGAGAGGQGAAGAGGAGGAAGSSSCVVPIVLAEGMTTLGSGGIEPTDPNVLAGSCVGKSLPERVFGVTPEADGQLTLTAIPSKSLGVGLHVHRDACDGFEAVCSASPTATFYALEGTTYYVVAEFGFSGPGPWSYALEATLQPDNPKDKCGLPLPLTASSGGTPSVVNDTKGAGDTLTPPAACGVGAGAGEDRVVAVTAAQKGTLHLQVEGSTSLVPILYVETSCGAPATSVGCAVAKGPGAPATLSLPVEAGDVRYVVVDSVPGTEGGYVLTVSLSL